MAVVSMQKIAVIVHKSKEDVLLEFLQKEGVVEVMNIPESVTGEHSEVKFRAAELDFAIETLMPFAGKKTLAAIKKKPTEEHVIRAALHTDILGIIENVHALEQDMQQAEQRLSHLKGATPAPVDAAATTPREPAYFSSSKIKDQVEKIGGSAPAESPEATQKRIAVEIAVEEKKLADYDAKLAHLSSELPHLLLARQYLRWLDAKQAVREAMQRTKSTVILLGWLPKEKISTFETSLQRLLPESALLKMKTEEADDTPVLLKNPTILKPFESVTTLYGLPKSSEFDPTAIISLFFILFFGLCLTDAGYGAVLALVMGIFIWKKKISIEEGRLWWLLLIGGIVTFFVSIPFGGWFGLTPQQAPAWLTETRADGLLWFKGQIWNLGETKGIAFFQNLSLALGLIHLSLGIFLSGFAKWRSGDRAAACWSDWTSLVLFASVGSYFLLPEAAKENGLLAIYAALVLVVWGKGYGSAWYLRPVFGLLGLLNLAMGMLSNTLSYLRLLALGLVTGALALAVNLVAEQIGALLPIFLAIPFKVIMYFSGHLLNIALNTLGAFIHSGRLQFVEFFGNFFEGGGRPFTPFRRSLSAS